VIVVVIVAIVEVVIVVVQLVQFNSEKNSSCKRRGSGRSSSS